MKGFVSLLGAMSLLLALGAGTTAAQGSPTPDGPLRLEAGPYTVEATVARGLPTVGGMARVTATVRSVATGAAVHDAEVVVRTRNVGSGHEGWVRLVNNPRTGTPYQADVKLEEAGQWAFALEISGALGQGSAELLTLVVLETPRSAAGPLVLYGVVVAFVAGGAFVWWSSRRALRRRAALRSQG